MIAKLKERAKAVLEGIEAFEENHRCYHRGGRGYHAKVKLYRYNDWDINVTIERLGLGPVAEELVLAQYTDEHIGEVLEQRLEDEREYLARDWISGCTVSTRQWYEENLGAKIAQGEPTGYPYLDVYLTGDYKSPELARLVLNSWIERDEQLAMALDQCASPAHFDGRMGGWFEFTNSHVLQGYFEDVQDVLDEAIGVEHDVNEGNATTKDYDEVLVALDNSVTTAWKMLDAFNALLAEIETMRKGLDGSAQYVLDEHVRTWLYEEHRDVWEKRGEGR